MLLRDSIDSLEIHSTTMPTKKNFPNFCSFTQLVQSRLRHRYINAGESYNIYEQHRSDNPNIVNGRIPKMQVNTPSTFRATPESWILFSSDNMTISMMP